MLNISNHPSSKWSPAQAAAAFAIDGQQVVDLPFPNVSPTASTPDVSSLARHTLAKAVGSDMESAMVQGEASLAFELTRMLMAVGFRVFVATSERRVTENPDGTKTAAFDFVQFRQIRP